MSQEPLVMDEIEAGANLIRDLNDLVPIKVAFWLHREEEDEKHLYIASDRFVSTERRDAYGEVQRILQETPSLFLDYDQVGLLPEDHRWAMAAVQFRDQSKDRLGTRIRSQMFAQRFIADAYIYPSTLSPAFPRAK